MIGSLWNKLSTLNSAGMTVVELTKSSVAFAGGVLKGGAVENCNHRAVVRDYPVISEDVAEVRYASPSGTEVLGDSFVSQRQV